MQDKIGYKVKILGKSLNRIILALRVNWVRLAFSLACFLGIILLANNIYGIVNRGYQRYEFIQQEIGTLNELRAENDRLNDELKYYSSYEYIDYKAREELNLIYPGSKLIYVDRGDKEIDKIDKYKPKDKNNRKPSWQEWWRLIFQ